MTLARLIDANHHVAPDPNDLRYLVVERNWTTWLTRQKETAYHHISLCKPFDTSVSDIVTESSDESLDQTTVANEPSSGNPVESAAIDSAQNEGLNVPPVGDEGLPEWEPLTPELVEDEAIRGDFVLRWAVVGLALLLGFSQIADTRSLVHLKSGEYLLNHGLLPGTNDVFSYTANERRWVNLSWMFDIASATVYSLSGGVGLSIVQGLLAGLVFGLVVHAVRPDIRTWWGSICAGLALLTCYPQFTVQPELISLLGLSFVLWMLVRSEVPGQSQGLWLLVPTLWLWAQFDQRAWFGWFLLLLWAAGQWLSGEISVAGEKSPLGKVALASLFVVAIHPFLWESWLAPVRLYLTDYPAMRFTYSLSPVIDQGFYPFWKTLMGTAITHRTIAALVLFAATLVSFLLNRTRVRWSHLYAFIGFNALGLFATHELAAASLVNCVLCTINAQTWYRERFGQVYSLDWRELLFSRGGRAITVFSFFALAWLILSGRLDGPAGKRTGLGFESQLASAMTDYRNLSSEVVDDKPFNFSMAQGDLMIWAGLKPFVDSRMGLYFGSGSANLLDLHNKARQALRRKREGVDGSGDPSVWKPTFDKYQIRQAWPRLNGPTPPPDYATFRDLMSSSDFQLSRLNAVTGVFLRTDVRDVTTTAFLSEHPLNLIEQAFRTKPTRNEDLTREWSKPATTYDNLFSLRRPIVPSGIQSAQHFLELALNTKDLTDPQRFAATLLAIRHSNEGLRDEPNSTTGHRILGMSYAIIGQLEAMILQRAGSPNVPNPMRYFQSVAALQQALLLQPDNVDVILQLIQEYRTLNRLDIQLDLYRKLKRLRPYSKLMTPEQRQQRDFIIDEIGRLEEPVNQIDSKVATALDEGADRTQVAVGAYQMGGLLRAIKTLEDDAIYLEKNPQTKLLLGSWLNEVGRGRDAEAIFEALEGIATDNALVGWRDSAAISSLTVANYLRTIKLWGDQLKDVSSAQIPQAMYSLPFLTLNPFLGPDPYPMTQVIATVQMLQGVRIEGPTLMYRIGLAQMEMGAVEDAANALRKAYNLNPTSPLRPILQLYLECLTGEQVQPNGTDANGDEPADFLEPETEEAEAKETESK